MSPTERVPDLSLKMTVSFSGKQACLRSAFGSLNEWLALSSDVNIEREHICAEAPRITVCFVDVMHGLPAFKGLSSPSVACPNGPLLQAFLKILLHVILCILGSQKGAQKDLGFL